MGSGHTAWRLKKLGKKDHRVASLTMSDAEIAQILVVYARGEHQDSGQKRQRVSGLGCGLVGGLVLGGVLFARTVSMEGLSFEAVMHLIFNLGFYGCIAAAIGYAIAGKWKKAGLSMLVLVAFVILYALFGVSILSLPAYW